MKYRVTRSQQLAIKDAKRGVGALYARSPVLNVFWDRTDAVNKAQHVIQRTGFRVQNSAAFSVGIQNPFAACLHLCYKYGALNTHTLRHMKLGL